MSTPAESNVSVDEWYRAIGHFVVKFEHACHAARMFVEFYLPGNSHDDHERKLTVINNLGARQLADAAKALLLRTGTGDNVDAEALADFEGLISERNTVVHSVWFIGWASPGQSPNTSSVTGFGPGRKLAGPAINARELTFEALRGHIESAERVREGLMRLLRHCA